MKRLLVEGALVCLAMAGGLHYAGLLDRQAQRTYTYEVERDGQVYAMDFRLSLSDCVALMHGVPRAGCVLED